jgi:proteasome lid subunit RPN8/RPN11
MRTRISTQLWLQVTADLLARTDVETAAILFGEIINADDGRRVLVIRGMASVPDSGYLERRIDRLRIDPVTINRLVRPARDNGWSVVTIHSHPGTGEPWFSWADDAGDARLMPSFAVQIPDTPHGSMVLAGSGATTLRLFEDGQTAASQLAIVGRNLTTWPAATSASTSEAHHRQRLALGEEGQAALAQLRVGVVGLGGTGSVVAAQLAHLGVGSLVLLDDDVVERTNLSRIVGAAPADIGHPKVEVAARYAAGLGVAVRAVRCALRRAEDAAALVTCDVVFSCVDTHVPRAILNRLSYDAHVPIIDVGTVFRVADNGVVTGDGGRVVLVGPGRPCMACWGILDPERLRVEQLSVDERERGRAEGYVIGADVPQPAVISFNTSVAGAAVTEFLRMATSFAGADAPPDRLSFSFSAGTVRRVSLPTGTSCRICGGARGRGELAPSPPPPAETMPSTLAAVSFGMPTFDEILQRLKRAIAAFAASGGVEEFYIGRSVNMEGRNSNHRSDDIRCLYETRSLERALDLEDALIKHFHDHPKNNNDQEHSGGNTAEGLQHVYLALWLT